MAAQALALCRANKCNHEKEPCDGGGGGARPNLGGGTGQIHWRRRDRAMRWLSARIEVNDGKKEIKQPRARIHTST